MGLLHPAAVWFVLSLAPTTTADAGDDQYRVVVGLLEKGMPELAVREAQRFLDEYGDHPRAALARYRLASALFDLERTSEAAGHFRELARLRRFEYAAEVEFRLGQCELALGNDTDATRALERVLRRGGDYLTVPATFLLGELSFRAGDFEGAERRFAEVVRAGGAEHADSVRDAIAGLAWCALRRGQPDRALERSRAFLERAGSDARADEMRFLAGEAHLEAGRPQRALEAYGSVRAGVWSDAALRGTGFAHAARGAHREAARAFGLLVERYPESRYVPEAALQQGVELLNADEPQAALAALDAGHLAGTPEDLYWQARAHLRCEQAGRALLLLDRALDEGARGQLAERIHLARGDALQQAGRSEEARQAWSRSDSPYALHAAAVTSLNEGRGADAIELASRLLRDDDGGEYAARARLVLAEGLLLEGRHQEAERVFRACLEESAGEAQRARCASRLAWCAHLAGRHGDAAQGFARVAERHRESPEAEEALYMIGRCLRESGAEDADVQGAWRAYLARAPRGERASEVRFELARDTADPSEAVRQMRHLIENDPGGERTGAAWFEIGERLSRAGDLDGAREAYSQVAEDRPDDPAASAAAYGLAWCLLEQGEAAESARVLRATLESLPRGEPLRATCLELLVWAQRERGDAAGVVAAHQALAGEIDDEERLWTTGRVAAEALREAGEDVAAARLLEGLEGRATDRGVRDSIRVERAWSALEAGDVDGAEALVREALQRDPGSVAAAEAGFYVGEARWQSGEGERAAELYAAASAAPGSPVADRALYKEGWVHLQGGRSERAASCFQRLLAEQPGSELTGESAFLLGESLFRLGRFERAAAVLERLIAERPRHDVVPKALFRLGQSQCRLERWDACQATLADLTRRRPDFENRTEVDLWRGRALARLDRQREARTLLEHVVEAERGVLGAQARIELGRLHLAAGRTDAALSEFLKVSVLYASEEEVAEALLLAGDCLAELGDEERARERWLEVLEDHPTSPHAAGAGERLGRRAERTTTY